MSGRSLSEVRIDHHLDQLPEAHLRRPAQLSPGLGCVSEQQINLGWAEELRRDLDERLAIRPESALVDPTPGPGERPPGPLERQLAELADGMRLAGGDHEVLRRVGLQHQPHRLDEVPGEAPIAARVEVPQHQRFRPSVLEGCHGQRDLASDKRLPAPRRLVVEQDPVDRKYPVRLPVIPRDVVGKCLGTAVGAAGVEGGGFLLRGFDDLAEQFRGRRLVEPRLQIELPDCFQNSQRPQAGHLSGVFGAFEADVDMRLGSEVVHLIGAGFVEGVVDRRAIG